MSRNDRDAVVVIGAGIVGVSTAWHLSVAAPM
jgi:glycine/D-amino acid oxidase-like deaminating enzyme